MCAVVDEGASSACGAVPNGEIGCCCQTAAVKQMTLVAIPGGTADPCTKAGVGDSQHPSCVEATASCGASEIEATAQWAPTGVEEDVVCCCH
jgi:hypothetical protein